LKSLLRVHQGVAVCFVFHLGCAGQSVKPNVMNFRRDEQTSAFALIQFLSPRFPPALLLFRRQVVQAEHEQRVGVRKDALIVGSL